ncbi:Hsp20/alpha crystallin family protein [Salinigranum halophilum]|jgi:HSP20 family protein|uniref:Hsp20/alpha crystallin family protein n=1 Tax=Salinigranum halophilum TaxID=2565931 RepID=UPI0010A93593|nr:Hsp20/alpha crystallin family protein [Salinigranum halophilum]
MADRPNPFTDIERFFEQMNRAFGDVNIPTRPHQIAVDVAETDEEIVVSADLPGFERDDVTLSLSGRDLTIDADHEETAEERTGDDDARYVRRERTHRSVSRTVRLPDAIDEEAASASYANGVLTVTLPRETVDDEGESHTIDIS